MNAPAAKLPVLIECERGLGRMLPRACAKRWQIANGKVTITAQMRSGGAGGVVNSPCRGCSHGEQRAKDGAHEGEPSLLRAGDLGLIAPHMPAA